jgi:hypothetical protein
MPIPALRNNVLQEWGSIGVQQLADDHEGVYQASKELTKYLDYSLQLQVPVDPDISPCVAEMAVRLEEHFADPLLIRFFRRRNVLFLTEVGPRCLYERRPALLEEYTKFLRGKPDSLETFLRKVAAYHKFMGQQEVPTEMIRPVLDWLVKETGNSVFVGQIDGTSLPGEAPCHGLEPNARMYRVMGIKDLPQFEPVTNHVAVVFCKEVLDTHMLPALFKELSDRTKSWVSALKHLTFYLEGVTTVKEYTEFCQKLDGKSPVGVVISSWGQALRIKYCRIKYCEDLPRVVSGGFLFDLDSLADDGLLQGSGGLVDGAWAELRDVLPEHTAGVVYTRQFAFSDLAEISRYATCVYTVGEQFNQAVLAMAAGRV